MTGIEIEKKIAPIINNLSSMNGEIKKMCEALEFSHKKSNAEGDNVNENWHVILGTMACSIIIRVCAFQDEINHQFKKKFTENIGSIDDAIAAFDQLLSKHKYRMLRNTTLAHNNRNRKEDYKLLTYYDIKEMVPAQDYTEYMKFGIATAAVIDALLAHFV